MCLSKVETQNANEDVLWEVKLAIPVDSATSNNMGQKFPSTIFLFMYRQCLRA